ncbi:MAG: thiamine biosynthesis protein ApbE [Spirochaetae bacterium HGW-Spirochaetae-9]|nr:MAG: thiamine biosynthesis protein ApbE [Spirochaetae bacterium HGW-Spirochaetae-9]
MKFYLITVIAVLFFSACAPAAQSEISRTDFVLGTVCSVRILEGGSTKTTDEIFARLKTIEDRMSANKDGTEIAEVNAAAGLRAVKVSADTFDVIAKGIEYAKLTQGAFDISIGPLVKLWNIGTDYAKVPPKAEIAASLRLVDYRKIELDTKNMTVRLPASGMRLDLGAIAKGYSADEIAKILVKHKVKAAVVDLGGNVLVFGKKKDGSPWRVGVQDPRSERGDYIGLVTGQAMTVVTSGIYERFFVEEGKHYHHILDTKTGWPADNSLVSVSIIAASSMDADALSTSLFALGLQKGMELAKTLPGINAIFIDDKNRVYLTPGANKIFTLSSTEYSLSERDQ